MNLCRASVSRNTAIEMMKSAPYSENVTSHLYCYWVHYITFIMCYKEQCSSEKSSRRAKCCCSFWQPFITDCDAFQNEGKVKIVKARHAQKTMTSKLYFYWCTIGQNCLSSHICTTAAASLMSTISYIPDIWLVYYLLTIYIILSSSQNTMSHYSSKMMRMYYCCYCIFWCKLDGCLRPVTQQLSIEEKALYSLQLLPMPPRLFEILPYERCIVYCCCCCCCVLWRASMAPHRLQCSTLHIENMYVCVINMIYYVVHVIALYNLKLTHRMFFKSPVQRWTRSTWSLPGAGGSSMTCRSAAKGWDAAVSITEQCSASQHTKIIRK